MKRLVIVIILVFLVIITVIVVRHKSVEKTYEYYAKLNKKAEYEERILFNEETREIYYEELGKYVVLGKNGKLYDKSVVKTIEPQSDESSSNKMSFDKYEVYLDGGFINVKYDNKIIVNKKIEYVNSGIEKEKNIPEISSSMVDIIDDQLLLRNTSYYWDYEERDIDSSLGVTYLINRKGISKTYNGYLRSLYNKGNSTMYFYYLNDNFVKIVDIDFKDVYSTDLEEQDSFNYYSCSNSSKPNYCLINDKFIDINTKKELDEKTYYYRSIDSNLGYTLIDNFLTVYYKNKKIGEFDEIRESLDGKYFLQEKGKKNIILELELKKRKKNE